jgi:hypothetical protein
METIQEFTPQDSQMTVDAKVRSIHWSAVEPAVCVAKVAIYLFGFRWF